MSVWYGKFKLPEIKNEMCEAPYEQEALHIKSAGLNPTEWLIVRMSPPLPFMLLQQRGGNAIAVLANVERNE